MSSDSPPPLPNEQEAIERLLRLEKNVVTCLCVVPFLFSAQCLLVSLTAPVFASMFADFGAKLPVATSLVLKTWPFWILLALAVPTAAVIVARRAQARASIFFSAISGLVMFVVAQCITLFLFLPIFQLGAIATATR